MMKLLLYLSYLCLLVTICSNVKANDNSITVDVLYFHATICCHACLTIEEFVNKSVQISFEKEMNDSAITLSSIDFLQPGNEHFQEKYDFDIQTLIISKKENKKEVKWKNLDKIWDYMNDFEKFK